MPNYCATKKGEEPNDLGQLHFAFIELQKFNIANVDKNSDMIEKWCYYFKHAEETTPEELEKIIGSDLVIKRAYEEVEAFNWTEEELDKYEQEIKRTKDNEAAQDYIFNQGIEKGIEQGIEKEKLEVIINMLKKNLDVTLIAEITGLSSEQILEIKKNNKF